MAQHSLNDTNFPKERQIDIPLARVQLLTDIIFASTMTLMVLSIEVPSPEQEMSNQEILRFLRAQLQSFGIYFISFILIAVYWLKHLEHFSYFQKTTQPHLWLQVFYLLFLAVFPFSISFGDNYPNSFPVLLIYSLNMFFIGIFSYCSWSYATRNHRLVDPALHPYIIMRISHQALVEPSIAVVAIGAALIDTVLWELTMLLIPVVFVIQQRLTKRRWRKKRTAPGSAA